ncbi:TetR/AcrR family transcriptional regulator [Actinopolyspora erythraea]|uniref:TetR family transcriptional regulator n=1 Tax=Actinopolyspora erythraea TaxID=414996 RepID=A0A099D7V8_9ACTN|nr:helix-turn-helix domain-containing protein [Actinopolyspora erythraea]ASU80029.1 TetR/AcrR family transcriptional regulator [Actinopolyspora erythraea]KGI82243.1 TetR family transcriptional regulator [Actinopolyspora erythraea]
MTRRTARIDRAAATRGAIPRAAERLFAEHGIAAVSNRRISEAAELGDSAAVGYHFGTRTEPVRAIAHEHGDRIERIRVSVVGEPVGSPNLRDWVSCLVRPMTLHSDSLGTPTWYARFAAQVMADPALHGVVTEESMRSESLLLSLKGMDRCLPELPDHVRTERWNMALYLTRQVCVERERALAEGLATAHADWEELATSLIDALTGLWAAPVTCQP